MILYAGASGKLGGVTVHELVRRGKEVRCLVRPESDISGLPLDQVDIVYGDVRDTAALKKAVQGIDTVISSFATNIAKDHSVATLWDADYGGNLELIKLARHHNVRKFVFVSYWGLVKSSIFEHGKIKKMVEDLLTVSGIDYTVFRVTTLATDMSLLLGTSLQKRGWSPMLMKRHEKIRPILLEDLAWCMADSLDNPRASDKIIEVAGTEEYTLLELQDLFSEAVHKRVRFRFIPPRLANTFAGCLDFATAGRYNARGLVAAFTGGSTCDITQMQDIFPITQGSFAEHLKDYFEHGKVIPQPQKGL